MALSVGQVTANAKNRTGLPFPAQPLPGTVPATTAGPTTVAGALQNTTNTVDQAKAALGATQPYIDQYLPPNAARTTPFRQSLTNTKATSTANAYDAAVANTRNKAAAAGFGTSSQPITFGAEAGLANERARAIAGISSQVNLEAQPIENQAAQLQQQQSSVLNALANTQQSQTGTLSAAELERERIAAQQKIASDQQKAALAGGLAQTGIAVGAPLIKSALTKTVAPAAATAAGVGTAAGGAGTAAAVGSAGLPLGASALGGTSAVGAGSAVAAPTGFGGGGLGASIGALATNPVTIGIAAALGTAILWAKSQAHHEASTFVRDYQDVFANARGTGHLNKVVNEFDKAYASGQMDKASAQSARNEAAALIEAFKQNTNAFSQQGSDENTVAHQAAQRMAELFGTNWEAILGKMDREIAGLA